MPIYIPIQEYSQGSRKHRQTSREVVELADDGYMFRLMRAILRLLVCLVTSASLAAAVIPAQAAVPQVVKAGCCAKMKMDAQADDCGHHAPKSNQEKECCAACVFGLALFFSPATPFIYPPNGEESFASLLIHDHLRSQRPPVPPPRV